MSIMMPGRAVAMQQSCVPTNQIAAALGVTRNQVVSWWRLMGYDPYEYHADAIVAAAQEGVALAKIPALIGLADGRGARVSIRALLERRGISVPATRPYRFTVSVDAVARCIECGILLEPYDPNDAEQQSWQNGTKDGVHCTACAERIRQGAAGVRCLR